MRDQFETEGWEMPIFRASAPTPPATRIASSSPTSLIGGFLYLFILVSLLELTARRDQRSIVRGYESPITFGKARPCSRLAINWSLSEFSELGCVATGVLLRCDRVPEPCS